MVDPHHLDHLRHVLTCQQVATHYTVRVRRAQGAQWQAHCFNDSAHAHGDRNPSLSLGTTHFQCFAAQCDIHGDVFDLIAQLEGLDPSRDFTTLVQIASDLAGLALPPKDPAPRAAAPPRRPPPSPTPFDGFFPPLGHLPLFDPGEVERRQNVMGHLWDIVAPAMLSEEASRWLKSRGIRPEVAWHLGARDWAMSAQAVHDYLATLCPQDLLAAGLAQAQAGEQGPKTWAGLEALRPGSWARGLCLPLVHPQWPRAPIAWRLRLHAPFSTQSGRSLKALAQYAGTPPLPSIPMGLMPTRRSTTHDRAPVYLLCEGEPDWLSLADLLETMEPQLSRPVYPIALVTMSSGYPYEFLPILEKAHRVVCLFDRGPVRQGISGGERVVEKLRGGLMHRMASTQSGCSFDQVYDRIDTQLVLALQADDLDVNDLHRRGELRGLLERLLQEAG